MYTPRAGLFVCNLAAGQVKGSVVTGIHQRQIWLCFVQQKLWNAEKKDKRTFKLCFHLELHKIHTEKVILTY